MPRPIPHQPIHWLRFLFFALVVRPLALVVLGMNIRHRERLPRRGPAIVVANHNSHLDALVMITLFPMRMLRRLRPVAAADYFFTYRWLAWFSLRVIGIIPIKRKHVSLKEDPLADLDAALGRGEILILFPEGARGEPEKLERFKSGIAHLAKRHPDVPITPLFLHGLGKALPRDEAVLVPFFCDVFVGEVMKWEGDKNKFMDELMAAVLALAAEGNFKDWIE